MALENQVRDTGLVTIEDKQDWLVSKRSGGVRTVTIDLDTFKVDDEDKLAQYVTGTGDRATVIYIRSGIPLARITDSGAYGPFDPDATDGRQLGVAGFLESMLAVSITFSGWELVKGDQVGMRYRGDIRKELLPVEIPDGTTVEGDIYDVPEEGPVTHLSAVAGGAATPGAGSITSAMLAKGAVNTNALGDKQVTAAKLADGVTPTWANLGGKPAAHAAIADVAGDGTVTPATVNAILAALRTYGIVANK
ncbi:hypothetical protein [Bifidobacterium tissieri]|uniref:Head fiber protein n=1 Tax=Bifidobacterium tissieri TaxID=1630162 RepID=A0A5M9ZVV3_9BIFI|nr:hypothetical protein [Bifidobacterium tissieri]KAA8829332.1 hypothetical protein EM849_11030 [Bifidobacterium tissieri]KAA8831645.1 hypothetical protein EMO89_02670 [Bifidobacterium tissieri]